MADTMKIRDAKHMFPGYDDYPSISVSGSLIGMRKQYGWDTKYVLKIGSYYYYLKGHPNAEDYFGEYTG